MVVVVVVV